MNWRSKVGIFWMVGLGLVLVSVGLLFAPSLPTVTTNLVVYKATSCGCCSAWVTHMEKNGFTVKVEEVADVTAIKRQLGVPPSMDSCHTGVIGNYLVEGHVPAEDVLRLLAEKPSVKGIAVPGMPTGSPGMEVPGQKPDTYHVITFTTEGQSWLFAKH
ncbi:MAG: DUF411 domain-containing protein [Magnetococcales bacterium]|nr:DUF411 domain-containing protein [Magnetococcales bacterium]